MWTPKLLRDRFRPGLGREGLQRQCVDFRTHAVAQHLVDLLVLLHPGFSRKQWAHDHRLEVLAVITLHLCVVA